MSSTAIKNSPGDYYLEQNQFKKHCDYKLYENSSYGKAVTTNFSGNGLLPGRIHFSGLSHHSTDIESFLRGTRSTVLVQDIEPVYGKLDTTLITELHKPNGGMFLQQSPIKNIASLNMFENPTVYIPSPLNMVRENRPIIR